MKNTASELFQLEPARSYSHSFSFIRMLAVQLRAVVRTPTTSTKTPDAKKGKSKDRADAFRSVYNWQFVHCLDFWSKVLGGACSSEGEKGGDSSLRPLIYPLVQIALGVIRCVNVPVPALISQTSPIAALLSSSLPRPPLFHRPRTAHQHLYSTGAIHDRHPSLP